MKEFNLSDKELKALLQEEGLEEPSLSFNRIILEKAQLSQKVAAFTIPIWGKVIFALLVVSPLIYLLITGNGLNLGMDQLNIKAPDLSLNVDLSSTYQYISLLTIATIWLAVLFNKALNQQKQGKVKNS